MFQIKIAGIKFFQTQFSKNCDKFWNDYNKCVNDGILIKNNLINPSHAEFYFNFLQCEQFDKLHNNQIQFNPNDIKYPYNKTYTIEKINDIVVIKFDD